MASLYRSQPMSLCQLFISSDAAYNCVSEIGELGLVQFRDLNPNVNSFQRKFVHEIRRCEEMERKLRFLEAEARKDEIAISDCLDNPVAPQPRELVNLEATFEKLEAEMKEVNANAETLKRNYLDLIELKYVLESSQVFFDEEQDTSTNLSQGLINYEEGTGPMQLGFVAGVINRERMPAFERMLWRVCRGNAFVRQQEIEQPLEDPVTGMKLHKVVYLIFFQGEQLKMKVKKICEGCKSTMYPCPETANERKEMIRGVKSRLDDLTTVLSQTTDHRYRVLEGAAKQLAVWFIQVRKIKGIYHILNMFNLDVTTKCLIAEAWVPTADINEIKTSLCKGTDRSGSTVQPILQPLHTDATPPTFYRTNKFTKAFQSLIDSYRVGSYREINPGLYTTTTFPFLFAVMFGDLGHGIIMALFGIWMVLSEERLLKKKSTNEIWNMFFGGRYIIMLMGLFSMYTGFIYNDIFSKSMNIFGSHYHVGNHTQHAVLYEHEEEAMLDPANSNEYQGTPYPVGMDPVWQLGLNKINYLNSYKMKISIIIGISHMMFGVILSLFNHRFFKRTINIVFEFIPQVIFLTFLFMYLVFLVFFKWAAYGAGRENVDVSNDIHCAPSILIIFINMMLMKGGESTEECPNPYMFPHQDAIQKALVLISLLCVPLMLFPKPFIMKSRHKKRMAMQATSQQVLDDPEDNKASGSDQGHDGEEEFDFGEVFIHQAIHTIEYVLGSISHTASYLRLWALSLAHAQLSEVLWMMVLKIGLSNNSPSGCIMLYLIFAAWAFLTISILVLMEGLSAFLHTLRLHWVEFCSKFYEGEGYLFTPFAFRHLVEDTE